MSRLSTLRMYWDFRVYGPPDGKRRYGRPKEYWDLGPCTYYRHYRGRSFVQAFGVCMVNTFAAGGTDTTIADTGGTNRVVGAHVGGNWDASNASGANNVGIFVGTGTTAVAMTDNKLATPIVSGTSSGQLNYWVLVSTTTAFSARVDSSTTSYISTHRAFNNNSGADISVTEAGLQFEYFDNAFIRRTFLMTRDVVSAITVSESQTLAAAIKFSISL